MKSALAELQERVTGLRRPSDFYSAPLELIDGERQTGNVRPHQTNANTEHEITLTVAARFWANQAEYRMAREAAERLLASTLYRDVLAGLDEIAHRVASGDAKGAMHAVCELRDSLTRV